MTNFLDSLFSLEGKCAVVTGASRGLGEAIAIALALAGADVVGVGRSPVSDPSPEGIFEYKQCDVTDHDEFKVVCENVVDRTGSLDVLVNAAGISYPRVGSDQEMSDFRETVETNLIAAYSCCNVAVKYMRQGGSGSIINITSIASLQGFPANPAYVASKGGLRALTKALAIDYSEARVRVNSLAPGYFRTSMTEDSFNDREEHKKRSARTAVARWGVSDDLAGAAVFLASDASTYVTGIDLIVDGGWTAKGM